MDNSFKTNICKGITKLGIRCRRKIKSGSFCHIHKIKNNNKNIKELKIKNDILKKVNKDTNKKNNKIEYKLKISNKINNQLKFNNASFKNKNKELNNRINKYNSENKYLINKINNLKYELNSVISKNKKMKNNYDKYKTIVEYEKINHDLNLISPNLSINKINIYNNEIKKKFKMDMNQFINKYNNLKRLRNRFCHPFIID